MMIPVQKSMQKAYESFFSPQEQKKKLKCEECGRLRTVFHYPIYPLLPPVLFVGFDFFSKAQNNEGDILSWGKKMKIPMTFKMGTYLYENVKELQLQPEATYTLVAVIDIGEYSLDEASYSAYVRREHPVLKTKKWHHIHCD
jgi:hypothetical protein